ncbi:hypothetical protein FOL47_001122 [Perkinsus chesapeaki]|uniref:Uncharacterized protein n=1 Tax=Perkinsus chesapeaki TaxID=330153 RepID=A0A7J6MLP8_PERCH|nr:hypothetical protein FOL47_001122 [Perkinsus chesapeaki]
MSVAGTSEKSMDPEAGYSSEPLSLLFGSACCRAPAQDYVPQVWLCFSTFCYLTLIATAVHICPDWTFDQYFQYGGRFAAWLFEHVPKAMVSLAIMFVFYILYRMRAQLGAALGLEEPSACEWFTVIGGDPLEWLPRELSGLLQSIERPSHDAVRQDLGSGTERTQLPSIVKSNDLFCEIRFGSNEIMRTRTYNNIGSRCSLRSALQLNVDTSHKGSSLVILVKSHTGAMSPELCRLSLSQREVIDLESNCLAYCDTTEPALYASQITGTAGFKWADSFFEEYHMIPRGRIWLRLSPIQDAGVKGYDFDDAELTVDEKLVSAAC